MDIDINGEETKMNDKKYLQKKRIIKYFIDAVKQIQEEEGLQSVTIRKVADIAGYNSATLTITLRISIICFFSRQWIISRNT